MSYISDQRVPLLDHFPYKTPRPIQTEALRKLAENWDQYDVFVLQAPTAFGKSAVAKTLLNYGHSASYITPTNLLVEQFRTEFPDTATLSRLDSYWCEEWKRDCAATRGKLRNFCKGCPCASALAVAKYRKGPGVYNYHVYTSYKLFREVLVVDEAHNLLPFIRERMALRLWHHDYGYPLQAYSYERLLDWVRSLPESRRKGKKIQMLHAALTSKDPEYTVSRTLDQFNGKGTRRGMPEDRDCIRLLPVDISKAPKIFWPSEVKKIVLMSATIEARDIEELGLVGGPLGKRVCYIKCKSPIPPENRPILAECSIAVNRQNIETAASEIVAYICDKLLPRHTGEKGVIHATYQLSKLMQGYTQDPRFIFHTQLDKRERYREFLKSSPTDGRVLVACGMYEGIDLPQDLGRWQVIAKIPWPYLGNPAVRFRADRDPEGYLWETLRTVIQACGRICRTPTDTGTTYILDSTFHRLFREAKHLMPEYFLEGLKFPDSADVEY